MANIAPTGQRFVIPDLSTTTNMLVSSDWLSLDGADSYTTSASSTYQNDTTTYGSINCFKRLAGGSAGSWKTGNYDSSAYIGTTKTVVSGVDVNGEFITITAPRGIVLKSYRLARGDTITSFNSQRPLKWVLAGSNDGGGTYTLIDSKSYTMDFGTGQPMPSDADVYSVPHGTASYTTFILIVREVTAYFVNGSAQGVSIAAWNLFEADPNAIACFARGTRVLTDSGYKAVEALDGASDRVMSSDRRAVPFTLHRTVIDRATATSAPYRIMPNAFGRNAPSAPVCLSPMHKINIRRGLWQPPAQAAVLNPLVQQYGVGERVEYYHIECEDYFRDDLVTEGLVVESFGTVKAVLGNAGGSVQDLANIYTWNARSGGFTRARSVKAMRGAPSKVATGVDAGVACNDDVISAVSSMRVA